MSDESPSKADEIDSKVVEDDRPDDSNPTTAFKWTFGIEKRLLESMIRRKPAGINKHLSMLLIRKHLYEEYELDIPTECIWNYLASKWDLEAADIIESSTLDRRKTDFVLPEEFNELIAEEGEKIKKLERESLNDDINKKIRSNLSFKDMVPSALTQEGPCTRRSLRSNDKQEISSSDEKSKLKDLKQLNKQISNQSQDMERTEKYPNSSHLKVKNSDVSESNLQLRNYKNNLTVLNIFNRSYRSVTPDILRRKTSYRSASVTPVTISRKSNLQSIDKNQKLKFTLEKTNLKVGHQNDPVLPEIKSEKQSETSLESKSKSLTPNKNEVNNQVKAKIRNRVTSDLLVVQQSPDIQPLGKRSCSNKNLKKTN